MSAGWELEISTAKKHCDIKEGEPKSETGRGKFKRGCM